MSRTIKILAVCGFGVGTSLILKMNIEKVMRENNIDAEVDNVDVTSATGMDVDLVMTSRELYTQIERNFKVPIIIIDNFMDINEIRDKSIDIIKKL